MSIKRIIIDAHGNTIHDEETKLESVFDIPINMRIFTYAPIGAILYSSITDASKICNNQLAIYKIYEPGKEMVDIDISLIQKVNKKINLFEIGKQLPNILECGKEPISIKTYLNGDDFGDTHLPLSFILERINEINEINGTESCFYDIHLLVCRNYDTEDVNPLNEAMERLGTMGLKNEDYPYVRKEDYLVPKETYKLPVTDDLSKMLVLTEQPSYQGHTFDRTSPIEPVFFQVPQVWTPEPNPWELGPNPLNSSFGKRVKIIKIINQDIIYLKGI